MIWLVPNYPELTQLNKYVHWNVLDTLTQCLFDIMEMGFVLGINTVVSIQSTLLNNKKTFYVIILVKKSAFWHFWAFIFFDIPKYRNFFEKLFRGFASFMKWYSKFGFLRCLFFITNMAPDTQRVMELEHVVKSV